MLVHFRKEITKIAHELCLKKKSHTIDFRAVKAAAKTFLPSLLWKEVEKNSVWKTAIAEFETKKEGKGRGKKPKKPKPTVVEKKEEEQEQEEEEEEQEEEQEEEEQEGEELA